MSLFERFGVERFLRSLHGWLGALILPWIVLAGLTGLYMNHKKLVLSLIPASHLQAPADFAAPGLARPVTTFAQAVAIAGRYRPNASISQDRDRSYRGRDVITVDTGPDAVVVDRKTGYAWVRERYRVTAYAPDGARLGTEWRWSRILASLHGRGWVGTALGRWLADITATALVVFGASGVVIFYAPKLRKRRNFKARMAAKAAAQTAAQNAAV